MKKFIVLIIVFIILICGCENKKISEYETPQKDKEINIKKLTGGYTQTAYSNFCTEKGMYSVLILGYQNNIVYSDFENEKMIYLCSALGCTHTDENCTSYIPASGYLFGDEDNLYYISDNLSSDNSSYNQVIYSLEPGGQNRKILYQFKGQQVYNGSHIFSDGENIYTKIEDVKNQTGSIVKITDTGSFEYLCECDVSDTLVSGKNAQLYIKRGVFPDNKTYYFSPQFEIISFDVNEKTQKQVYLSEKSECKAMGPEGEEIYKPILDTAYIFKGSDIYYLKRDEKILKNFDMLSGEENIAAQLNNIDADWTNFSLENINENYCIINFLSPQADRYIIDLNSQQIYKNTLKTFSEKSKEEVLLDPICITENKVVFYNGGSQFTEKYQLPDGSYEFREISFPAVNYISIDDYLNNKQNYIKIDFEEVKVN